jgi:hypothetical protein
MRGDAERAAEQRLARSGPEGHDDPGTEPGKLRLEPRTAGAQLPGIGPLVNAPFPAARVLLPAKVLDRIGDVGVLPADSGLAQGLVEYPARGSYKGRTLAVLRITGLLADQDQ